VDDDTTLLASTLEVDADNPIYLFINKSIVIIYICYILIRLYMVINIYI
jgi:hypothetical protein